ncbi:MAG: CPBP family intramembrane metalloprotease [Rhodobacterales bacterium]|nr:CPBP family intramembrane metalloprotease [Rhodobacterales bacterium]
MIQVGVNKGAVIREIVAIWLLTLLAIRAIVALVEGAGLPEIFLAAVPILFMYVPVWVCWFRGVDSFDYPLYLPRFDDKEAWSSALWVNGMAIGVILLPFLIGYHFWQTLVMGFQYEGLWPESPIKLIGYQLFFVAIPEEFFYRAYMQSRLDEVFRPKWRIFGADLGWGWILTCLLFAFGHSIVLFQWWHFAIFFPSLVFGWMRARTGGIIAGALFHAWSNITVSILDTLYGILPPSS